MEQEPRKVTQIFAKKKWLLVAIVMGVVLLVGAILFAVSRSSRETAEPQRQSAQVNGPKNFTMTTTGNPVKYAGSTVYDACSLISFDTIRSTVKDYQAILDMNGTDKKPSEPLTIEHRYIDRDIVAPLGHDGQPRPTGTQIGGDAAVDASSFISQSDSNCWYGQGNDLSLGIGKTFAKVYVTQKPTPLSGDLLGYLRSLTKAGSAGDVAAYVEPKTDAGGFFTGIVTNEKKGVVVFVKASTKDLGQKAITEASGSLTEEPKGPMNLAYPQVWAKMPNPCSLFSADDFQTATAKPAGALAEDTMGLSEIGGGLLQRSCERLELERLDNTPIAKTNVTVRMGKDEKAAKDYVAFLRNNKDDTFDIVPLKQKISLAGDAYIAASKDGDKVSSYELHMRIGQAVIVLAINTEKGLDPSADAFASRILPFAQKVAERYKQ